MSALAEWTLAFCGIDSTPIDGKSKPKAGCKTCVPKELLFIWFIVTVLVFIGIDYMSRIPYEPEAGILSEHSHQTSQNESVSSLEASH